MQFYFQFNSVILKIFMLMFICGSFLGSEFDAFELKNAYFYKFSS